MREMHIMQIVSIHDLKNTIEIKKKAAIEPEFATKNGYGRLLVTDIDYSPQKTEKWTRSS